MRPTTSPGPRPNRDRHSTPSPQWAIPALLVSVTKKNKSLLGPVVAALGSPAALVACGVLLAGCVAQTAPPPQWPPLAKKWYERGKHSYHVGDVEDAELAVGNALRLLPDHPKVKLLAARVALAQLEYDRCLELLAGLEGAGAQAARGRAYWYSGSLDAAADELEELLQDPEVRDPWAQDIAKLARRGTGRKPFEMTGDMLAVAEMPETGRMALLVPVEVNGEPALGMVATNVPEAVLDSSAGASASWISLRFGGRVEVRDVPALAKDLSGLSRQVNAPIKILLGVNLLRHLNVTFDLAGSQFVVRTFEPPPPPYATTVHLSYLRGGGMVFRSGFGTEENGPMASLFVDSSMSFPIALDAQGWKKAGVAVKDLQPVEGAGSLRQGVVPLMHFGAFEVPELPGLLDGQLAAAEESLNVDLDGAIGAGLLGAFRVTLADGGRTMWLEDLPRATVPAAAPDEPSGPAPDGAATSPADQEPLEALPLNSPDDLRLSPLDTTPPAP